MPRRSGFGRYRLVEAVQVSAPVAGTDTQRFSYFNPTLWQILQLVPISSQQRIVLTYPGHGHTVSIDLEGPTETVKLRLDTPRGARCAELAYRYDAGPGPDVTSFIGRLNQRPDTEVDLLLAASDSDAWIPVPDPGDTHGYASHYADFPDIDNALQTAGIFDLDPAQGQVALRLLPDWSGTLPELAHATATICNRDTGLG